ncbi:MAG: SDR family oxidoreductase [Actinomycetales bacterium]
MVNPSTPEQALAALIERSQFLGADESLVVLGGGNTSAKGRVADHLGREHEVLWVKGSGAHLRTAQVQDFPALRLAELLPLRELTRLSDDQMLQCVGQAMVDTRMRRPSIETLLHAFLPHVHIDHVHADAICTLTNHRDGPTIVREALGEGFAYVDWIRPGFELSRLVADLANYQGVVLAHHGLVTWGTDSAVCLGQTMNTVEQARAFIEAYPRITVSSDQSPRSTDAQVNDDEKSRELLLQLRGAMAQTGRRILQLDRSQRGLVDDPRLTTIASAGVSSADHMLTIKPRSMVLLRPQDATASIAQYADHYRAFVEQGQVQTAHIGDHGVLHDPMPRVILAPGFGMITTGRDRTQAAQAAQVARHTHTVAREITERFGIPEPLTQLQEYEFDYWPLEMYKLSLQQPPAPLTGSICIVTGAASGIGRGIAEYLAAQGASLVLADLDAERLAEVGTAITTSGAPTPELVAGDQSSAEVVHATMNCALDNFGGIDGVVLNAGIAAAGRLTELRLQDWERAQRINLTSAFLLTQQALQRMRQQGCGGSLVYVASKNAFGPGAGFGAYSVSKAGMIQLMRIAALEGGGDGIRANAVNPDAVFDNSRLWEGGIREERAAAHGIDPEQLQEFYAARNLLHRQVTTNDVALAVEFLLSERSSRTTGAVLPVDGGVAGAFPR